MNRREVCVDTRILTAYPTPRKQFTPPESRGAGILGFCDLSAGKVIDMMEVIRNS